jgi:SulP family sulfate permease
VVAFSSSLDVAAIEMELGLPLDYNRELQTVGISNLFSGLTGGYTGSYIFSQTLFSLRQGVTSRVGGATVALVELIIVVLPVSVTSYLPKVRLRFG